MAFGDFLGKLVQKKKEQQQSSTGFSASLKYLPGEVEQEGEVRAVGKTVTLVENTLKNPHVATEERTQIPLYTGNPFRPAST